MGNRYAYVKNELRVAKKNRDAALGTYRSTGLARVGAKVRTKLTPAGTLKDVGIYPPSVPTERYNALGIKTNRQKYHQGQIIIHAVKVI